MASALLAQRERQRSFLKRGAGDVCAGDVKPRKRHRSASWKYLCEVKNAMLHFARVGSGRVGSGRSGRVGRVGSGRLRFKWVWVGPRGRVSVGSNGVGSGRVGSPLLSSNWGSTLRYWSPTFGPQFLSGSDQQKSSAFVWCLSSCWADVTEHSWVGSSAAPHITFTNGLGTHG